MKNSHSVAGLDAQGIKLGQGELLSMIQAEVAALSSVQEFLAGGGVLPEISICARDAGEWHLVFDGAAIPECRVELSHLGDRMRQLYSLSPAESRASRWPGNSPLAQAKRLAAEIRRVQDAAAAQGVKLDPLQALRRVEAGQ